MPDISTGAGLRAEREARGWSRADLARRLRAVANEALPSDASLMDMIKQWEAGKHERSARYLQLCHKVFAPPAVPAVDDEIEALGLARRVAASDVGEETLTHLELAFEDLATSYSRTPPAELLGRVRRHLAYVGRLLDGRKTLGQHRRLLVTGGWLSLLAATCHVDLHQRPTAGARLRTAVQLAEQAGHPEITAWCLETEAWQALTDGDYQRAVTLAQAAQGIAPKASSAYIQASAQEGRAWSRLGDHRQTHLLLDRVTGIAGGLATPDRPEHHYRYDPAKATAYAATTLAWLGDPAAEPLARQVLAHMQAPPDGPPRLRRAASARLDLSLALIASGEADEAARETLTAVTSGLLVPSNYWRAAEVIDAVETRRLPEAADLREAYRDFCSPAPPTDLPETN
ncbi:hypothetical protein GCM10027589_04780 [Actinocorallia lasiicapitis]